jgi:hypothetical protein
MRVRTGLFWTIKARFRCITTNGMVRKNGNAIMGHPRRDSIYINNTGLFGPTDIEHLRILGYDGNDIVVLSMMQYPHYGWHQHGIPQHKDKKTMWWQFP